MARDSKTEDRQFDNYKAIPALVWLLYRWVLMQGLHNKMADAAVQPCPTLTLARLSVHRAV